MITPIQKNTPSFQVDYDRNLSGSTLQDIHVAQARQTLGDLENYQQGDLLRDLRPQGKKEKISTKTVAKHVAYLEGYLELVSKMTDTAVATMKLNGEMSDLMVNNANTMQRDGEAVSAKTTQAVTDYVEEKQKAEESQKSMAIFGYILAGLMAVMTLGTGTAAGVLMAACIVAQQCMSNIKDKDGKTVMDKLTDACGGKKWAADLIIDACVLVLTCGAGVAEAAANSAKNVAVDAAETGATTAAQDGATTAAQEGATTAAQEGATTAAQDGAENGAENGAKTGAESAVETGATTAAQDGAENAAETGATGAAKKTEKEAVEKLKEAMLKEAAKSQVENAEKKAFSKETLDILKEGLKAGAKLGMQIDMSMFNPLGDAFSDIYYNAGLRPGMSDLDKQKLRGEAELGGAIFGALTSLCYGVASYGKDCLNGFKGSTQIFNPSRMQLMLKVSRAIQAISMVGQGVTAAILSSIFKQTADTQTEIAGYKGELAKVKFSIDTTSEVRDQIQKEAAKNSSFFFDMLDMMVKASKTAFKLN